MWAECRSIHLIIDPLLLLALPSSTAEICSISKHTHSNHHNASTMFDTWLWSFLDHQLFLLHTFPITLIQSHIGFICLRNLIPEPGALFLDAFRPDRVYSDLLGFECSQWFALCYKLCLHSSRRLLIVDVDTDNCPPPHNSCLHVKGFVFTMETILLSSNSVVLCSLPVLLMLLNSPLDSFKRTYWIVDLYTPVSDIFLIHVFSAWLLQTAAKCQFNT